MFKRLFQKKTPSVLPFTRNFVSDINPVIVEYIENPINEAKQLIKKAKKPLSEFSPIEKEYIATLIKKNVYLTYLKVADLDKKQDALEKKKALSNPLSFCLEQSNLFYQFINNHLDSGNKYTKLIDRCIFYCCIVQHHDVWILLKKAIEKMDKKVIKAILHYANFQMCYESARFNVDLIDLLLGRSPPKNPISMIKWIELLCRVTQFQSAQENMIFNLEKARHAPAAFDFLVSKKNMQGWDHRGDGLFVTIVETYSLNYADRYIHKYSDEQESFKNAIGSKDKQLIILLVMSQYKNFKGYCFNSTDITKMVSQLDNLVKRVYKINDLDLIYPFLQKASFFKLERSPYLFSTKKYPYAILKLIERIQEKYLELLDQKILLQELSAKDILELANRIINQPAFALVHQFRGVSPEARNRLHTCITHFEQAAKFSRVAKP